MVPYLARRLYHYERAELDQFVSGGCSRLPRPKTLRATGNTYVWQPFWIPNQSCTSARHRTSSGYSRPRCRAAANHLRALPCTGGRHLRVVPTLWLTSARNAVRLLWQKRRGRARRVPFLRRTGRDFGDNVRERAKTFSNRPLLFTVGGPRFLEILYPFRD